MLLLYFLAITLLSKEAFGLQKLVPSENYTQSFAVDKLNPDDYIVFWKIVANEIVIEIHCKTIGWVGIGLSPDGNMIG